MHVRLASLRWLSVPALAAALLVGVSTTAPTASAQCITTYYGTTYNCNTYYQYYTSMPYYTYGSPFAYATGYPWYATGGLYSLNAYPYSGYGYYPYSYTGTYPYYSSYMSPYSYGYPYSYYPYSSGYGYGMGYPGYGYGYPYPLNYYANLY